MANRPTMIVTAESSRKLAAELKRIDVESTRQIANVIYQTGVWVASDARRDIPKAEGSGLASKSIISKQDPNGMSVTISVGTLYAPYLEFGTGIGVSVPPGYEAFAIQFKGGHIEGGMRARPYLIPAFEYRGARAMKAIEQIIEKAIK